MATSAQLIYGKDSKPMNVVVIGGSIAGLMQGIMLKRLGHNLHILDRSPSSERGDNGAGITLGPEAQEFYKRYDLMQGPYSIPNPGIQFLNARSEVRYFMKRPMEMSTWSLLYYRLRANFDGYKSELCPSPPGPSKEDGEAIFDFGKKVTNVTYVDGIVTVHYNDLINSDNRTIEADLVIVADGASSSIRPLLLPDVHHNYSGYIAWRGYVDERKMSKETMEVLEHSFSSCPSNDGYILSYLIPGENGSLEPGSRLVNWVWYTNCPTDSSSFSECLTDISGHQHRNFLPLGKMRPSVWQAQLEHAASSLSAPMLEMVRKTTNPAISVIHDYASPRAVFFDGRLLLVGDALALFRPHAALSFNQAAMDCLLLEKAMKGEMDIKTWEMQVVRYGSRSRAINELMGSFLVYGGLVFVKSLFRCMMSLLPL
ncbi:hypothetical protein MMC17_009122 [Xylographa soralifera]|nr:hypothetical protein [Xylographa soralifera]